MLVVSAARGLAGAGHLGDAALAVPSARRLGRDHCPQSSLVRDRGVRPSRSCVELSIGGVRPVLNTLPVTNS
ncbi:hypothetical protein GCM10023201_14320 [Actinomycetospora corticicola]